MMAGDIEKPEDEVPAVEETPVAELADEADATAVEPLVEVEAEEKPKPKRVRKPAAAKAKADDPAEEAADAPKPKKAPAKKAADTPAPNEKAKPKGAKPSSDVPSVRAQAKYVRTSARKARLVCDNIRGKSVDEARAILAFTPRAVARDWTKLLESAVANAEHNHELVGDDLRVATAYADEGPTLKRFRPRAMGRATSIRKRTSHLTITLSPKE